LGKKLFPDCAAVASQGWTCLYQIGADKATSLQFGDRVFGAGLLNCNLGRFCGWSKSGSYWNSVKTWHIGRNTWSSNFLYAANCPQSWALSLTTDDKVAATICRDRNDALALRMRRHPSMSQEYLIHNVARLQFYLLKQKCPMASAGGNVSW